MREARRDPARSRGKLVPNTRIDAAAALCYIIYYRHRLSGVPLCHVQQWEIRERPKRRDDRFGAGGERWRGRTALSARGRPPGRKRAFANCLPDTAQSRASWHGAIDSAIDWSYRYATGVVAIGIVLPKLPHGRWAEPVLPGCRTGFPGGGQPIAAVAGLRHKLRGRCGSRMP